MLKLLRRLYADRVDTGARPPTSSAQVADWRDGTVALAVQTPTAPYVLAAFIAPRPLFAEGAASVDPILWQTELDSFARSRWLAGRITTTCAATGPFARVPPGRLQLIVEHVVGDPEQPTEVQHVIAWYAMNRLRAGAPQRLGRKMTLTGPVRSLTL